MPTLGDMKQQIARDLARPSGILSVPIANAIRDAITFYQRQKFPQNWQDVDLTTAPDQYRYDVATDGLVLDIDHAEHLGQRYSLRIRPRAWVAGRHDPNLRGDPLFIALAGPAVLLHPVPHTAVALTMRMNISPPIPTEDDHTNFWTEDAYSLIRHHAKGDLFMNTLRGPAAGEGQLAREQASSELASLLRQHVYAQRPYPPRSGGGWV